MAFRTTLVRWLAALACAAFAGTACAGDSTAHGTMPSDAIASGSPPASTSAPASTPAPGHASLGTTTMLASTTDPRVAGARAPATCWEQAAQRHRVNPHLLVAIAEVESGLRPQAIGRNRDGSLDLGLMQINTLWLPELRRHGITARDLLDPCVSVHVGAWVLAQKIQRHGNTWVAVGAYNAGSAVLRERYARKVVEALLRRGAIGGGEGTE